MSWVSPPAADRSWSVRPNPPRKAASIRSSRRIIISRRIRWSTPIWPRDTGRAASCRSCRAAKPGTATDCTAALKAVDPNINIAADAHLSVRLAVELRARHQDGVARSPTDRRCSRVLHQVEEHSAGDPPFLRLSIHCECRRRGEQGRRIGGPRKADRTPRDFARFGLPGRENHRSQHRVSAAGRLAHLSGARLDRQRVGAVHGAAHRRVEDGEQRRLLLYRQEPTAATTSRATRDCARRTG